MSAISFRPVLPADAETLAELYIASIEQLAEEDYSPQQCTAWASFGEDSRQFGVFLGGFLTILAERNGEVLGFASLKDNTHIKMLYVAPEHARQGIGKALVEVMELLARQRGAEAMTVDASETAYELFDKLGYERQARNTILIADEWLANTTMKKQLPAAEPKVDA